MLDAVLTFAYLFFCSLAGLSLGALFDSQVRWRGRAALFGLVFGLSIGIMTV